jgi:predicted ATPase
MEPAEVVRLVDQVAGALEAAHRQGVVHRDLKPSNIMLDELGNAYLTDFGIAKHLEGTTIGTPTGAIIGSPAYMAPEQIKGEEITPQSDLYSLGGLIFEMLTGEPPFGLEDPAVLLYRQLHKPLPLVCEKCPELPPAVDTVLQKATAKDPADRYADVLSLAEAFAVAIRRPELITVEPFLTEKGIEVPHNLPVQSTPFIGREEELAALEEMLIDPDTRLITIVGPGGIGKTRLVLAIAERQLGNFKHGVFFVSLASLDAVEDIVPAVARGLGFSFYEGGDHRRQLIDYLRAKSMLLLLDNFEHLLEGASLASEIVQAASGVRVIVTSREPLRLLDEQLFSVRGLDFPEWETPEDALEYDAARLFLSTARRSRSKFDLGQDDLQPMTRICRLVQGMPLGIVLAAGWVELLSLAEIAEELGRGIDILKTDIRDVPMRQRSMRIVLDTTWEQLNLREREVLKRLSVFRDGCSQKAIRQVTGATFMELKSMTGKSLINSDQDGRLEMHRLLRQYAAEKLDRDHTGAFKAHDHHSEYYLAAVVELEDELHGPHVNRVIADIDDDLENIRKAWRWAASHQVIDRLEQAIAGLFAYYFWNLRSQAL